MILARHIMISSMMAANRPETKHPALDRLLGDSLITKPGWACAFLDKDGSPLKEFKVLPDEDHPHEERFRLAKKEMWTNVNSGMIKIKQLAEEGYVPALAAAADFYDEPFFNKAGEADEEVAFELTKAAVDAGYEGALARLALYYFGGNGTPRDRKKAEHYFRRAIESRHPGNYRWLALACGTGAIVGKKDPKTAKIFIDAAIADGDMLAFLVWITLIDLKILPGGETETPELVGIDDENPIAEYVVGQRHLSMVLDPRYPLRNDERFRIVSSLHYIRKAAYAGLPVANGLLEDMLDDESDLIFDDGVKTTVAEMTAIALKSDQESEAERKLEKADARLGELGKKLLAKVRA